MIRDAKSDYDIYKRSTAKRSRNVTTIPTGADYHIRNESQFFYAMEIARDIDRNDPVVGQGIDRAVNNIIRDGVKLDVDTGSDRTDRTLSERWQEWAASTTCSWNNQHTFHSMEKRALRAIFVDGDILALPTEEGSLRMVEAHRLKTPTNSKKDIIHGVQVNSKGVPIRYYISKENLNPSAKIRRVMDTVSVPAYDEQKRKLAFHLFMPKRFTQRRGFTVVAPVEATVTMHDDIHLAKLVQQQAVSMFAILRERQFGYEPQGTSTTGGPLTAVGPRSQATRSDANVEFVDSPAMGLQFYGEPGETLKAFAAGIPNPEFFDHVKLMLTYIALNLGLPYAALTLDMSEHNFNSWRGAMDQARLGFKSILTDYVSMFHEEVYMWKLEQWVNSDASLRRQRIDVTRHTWQLPTPPYIQPLEDSEADASRRDNLQISPSALAAERGIDYEAMITRTVADNAFAIESAQKEAERLNSSLTLATPLTWQDLLLLPFYNKNLKVQNDPTAKGSAPVSKNR